MANSPSFDVVNWFRQNTWWLRGALVVVSTCGSAWGLLYTTQRSQGNAIETIGNEIPEIRRQLDEQKKDLKKQIEDQRAELRQQVVDQQRDLRQQIVEYRAELLGAHAFLSKDFHDFRDAQVLQDRQVLHQLNVISQDLGRALGRSERRGALDDLPYGEKHDSGG